MTVKSILINQEGYIYLHELGRTQRGFDVTPKIHEHYVKAYEHAPKCSTTTGEKWYEATGDTFGGGTGSQNWSTWTRWDVDYVAKLLDEKGLPYEFGTADITYIYF